MKDAAILSNCDEVEVRKQWIVRITDHDGVDEEDGTKAVGGIEAWIQLGDAVGLTREQVTSLKMVSPGVKFAVDAYVNFAKQRPWQESVCSSLTELFAPHIHQQRISSWPTMYPGIKEEGLSDRRRRHRPGPGADRRGPRLGAVELARHRIRHHPAGETRASPR